ncbi:hypothetical protein [Saccharopolyspora sp. NPDC049426]|uniref:hypothetical protein n=1 Tax=Saccharopolyspora sp. NPDC049426 TaxID=3155652 RepID=UPI00342B0C42
MNLPKYTRFQYGHDESRIFLDDAHVIGILDHPREDSEVRVTFCGPSGTRFAMPAVEDITGGVSSIITASLHYDYRAHEIAIGYVSARGYGVCCPTCHTAGTVLSRFYDCPFEAQERAVADHEDLCGQPAVVVAKPVSRGPDRPPPNAWPTEDPDRS